MQEFDVNELKEHPRNQEFFDDISGDEWKDFLQSIKTSGVIEPIVITQNKVIVSGHQRVRACKELGIPTIMAEMRDYKDEDEILKALLETNLRQRGTVGGSVKQIGRRIMELERLYGIKNGGKGGNRYQKVEVPKNSEAVESEPQTQADLAKQLGISVDTLNNYKTLTQMIPELEELVDTGMVSKSAALAMIRELDSDEQEQLVSSLDVTHRITSKEIKSAIEAMKDDFDEMKETIAEKDLEISQLKDQIKVINKDGAEEKRLAESSLIFRTKVEKFIKDVGGYVWLSDRLNDMPDEERLIFIHSIQTLEDWVIAMKNNINGKEELIA